jgi:hypothetical protein
MDRTYFELEMSLHPQGWQKAMLPSTTSRDLQNYSYRPQLHDQPRTFIFDLQYIDRSRGNNWRISGVNRAS